KYFNDIAEHSMCQPGLPLPHGLSHAGSSEENFHKAKSRGSSFVESTSILAPDSSSSTGFLDSLLYPGNDLPRKYTPLSVRYACSFSIKPPMSWIISLMCSVAFGL